MTDPARKVSFSHLMYVNRFVAGLSMRWKNEYLDRTIRKINWKPTQRTAWLFMAMMISCTVAIHSTSIIVIRRERQVTIAADSKAVWSLGGAPIAACKIKRLSGGVFFAASGFVEDTGAVANGFAADEIALKQKGTISVRAAGFAKAIQDPLLQAARRARQRDSEAVYRKVFGHNNAVILQAIFIGMEDRVASVRDVSFTKIEDAQGNPLRIDISTRACPGSPCENAEAIFISMGQTGAAQAEITSIVAHPTIPANDAKTARHLVETEIIAQPDQVGLPIAVLQIDNSGEHWIDKGECGQPAN